MPTTRCKAQVWDKTDHYRYNPETGKNDGEYYGSSISLGPCAYGTSEENASFFEATPSLSISLGVVNPAGAALFKQGQEVYVDFTPVEPIGNTEADEG